MNPRFWRPFKFRVWLTWRLLGVLTHDEHMRWRRVFDKAMSRDLKGTPCRKESK